MSPTCQPHAGKAPIEVSPSLLEPKHYLHFPKLGGCSPDYEVNS
jgi:hypothetical protein